MQKNIAKLIIVLFIFSLMFFSYYDESTAIITKIMLVVLFIPFLFKAVSSKESFCVISAEFIILIIWLGFAAITGLFAANVDVFFGKFLSLLQIYLASLLVFNVVVWLGSSSIVWLGIYLATILISIMTLKNPVAYSELGRYSGTLGNANLFAFALLVSYVYAMNRIFADKKFYLKAIYLASTPLLIYMVAGTGSRKAILGVILFLLLFVVMRFRNSIKERPYTALATALLLVVIIFGIGSYFTTTEHFDRIEVLFNAAKSGDIKKAGGSAYNRLKMYEAGLEMLAESPAIGFGLDNYRVKFPEYIKVGGTTYSHSNFIEILVGTGIIGGMLYFSIYGFLAFKLFRMRNIKWGRDYQEQYIIATSIFTLYVVYDFAMVSYYGKVSWLVLSTIISAVWLLERERKRIQLNSDKAIVINSEFQLPAESGCK